MQLVTNFTVSLFGEKLHIIFSKNLDLVLVTSRICCHSSEFDSKTEEEKLILATFYYWVLVKMSNVLVI